MGSFALRGGRMQVLTVLIGLLAALLLVADRAAAYDEGGIEDNPPMISGGAVSPSSLSFTGGNVQLSADVIDDFGVAMVYAQIYGPDGSIQSQQLFQGGANSYFGTLEVPQNNSELPLSYGVEIQAWDTNGAYVATLIGDVQVEGAPQFDEFPYLGDPQLTPTILPPAGGEVTIAAEASDNHSISTVFAIVALPGGGTAEVPLQPVSYSRYQGTFTAPPNPGPPGAEYQVEIAAQDDIGQESRVLAGTVTVEAPPPAPSPGRLQTWPATRNFGSVRSGATARRVIVVRNGPRRGGGPVEATARVAGSPSFSLAGAPAEGIHFVLAPGEVRTFLVEFRPTASGDQSAALEFVREDGAQPGFSVALSGRGTAPRIWHPTRPGRPGRR